MRLYKTIFTDRGGPAGARRLRISWQGTQAEARAQRVELKLQGKYATTSAVEVPINKPGLLAWLNKHVKGCFCGKEGK